MITQRKVAFFSSVTTLWRAAVSLAWLTFAALPAAAQVLPSPASSAVSDFARVLDPAMEAKLAQSLAALREETGVQMVVVTLPRLELYGGAGMRIDDYATALFTAWGIGDADRDDGLLMLVVTESSEARFALGAGYDPVYDERAARVLSTAVLPEFRAGRLGEGIAAGVVSARERLVLPFVEGRAVDLDEGFTEAAPEAGNLWLFGAGGFVAWLIFMVRRFLRKRRTCPSCGALALTRTYEVIDAPTASLTGTGMEHLTCGNCGLIDRKSYVIAATTTHDASQRTIGSGSDGGFCGGSFSGGGASGKW